MILLTFTETERFVREAPKILGEEGINSYNYIYASILMTGL